MFSNFGQYHEALKEFIQKAFVSGSVILEPIDTAFDYAIKQTKGDLKFPFISIYPAPTTNIEIANNNFAAYKEGTTLESSTMVKKGYVNHIYYSASDTITPTRVEIDLAYYTLGCSEVKFAFSYAGTISVGDQIVFIYTKNLPPKEEGIVPPQTGLDGVKYYGIYSIKYLVLLILVAARLKFKRA